MTELSKYIGPDQDLPGVGTGVGAKEIGYLYGQYKRTSIHHAQKGKGLLWGGTSSFFYPPTHPLTQRPPLDVIDSCTHPPIYMYSNHPPILLLY